MSRAPIFSLKVGYHVVTTLGLREHGPSEGPKVSVPAGTAGLITDLRTRFGSDLWFVAWSTGQSSGHYPDDLRFGGSSRTICIGDCLTLDEFKDRIPETVIGATVRVGPQGGFKSVELRMKHDTSVLLTKAAPWTDLVQPLLIRRGIPIEELPIDRAAS